MSKITDGIWLESLRTQIAEELLRKMEGLPLEYQAEYVLEFCEKQSDMVGEVLRSLESDCGTPKCDCKSLPGAIRKVVSWIVPDPGYTKSPFNVLDPNLSRQVREKWGL